MGLTRPDRAVMAAAGTVVLWASAFPAISVAVRSLGATGLSVARLVVASAALACVTPFVTVRRPRARDLPLIALCGLSGMTVYQLLLNAGERTVPAGTASLLIATAPVYSALIAAALLGERSTPRRWVGSAIAFVGSAVIAASHGLGFGASALVVLAAAVAQATYHTAQKPLLARYTGLEVTAYATWSGTVFIAPWTGSALHALPRASAASIGSAVFLGVAPSALGFVLWGYAVARMDVGRATTALYLVPAVAILVAFLMLGQAPGAIELAGGAVALAGVVLANTRSRRQRRQAGEARSQPAGDDVEDGLESAGAFGVGQVAQRSVVEQARQAVHGRPGGVLGQRAAFGCDPADLDKFVEPGAQQPVGAEPAGSDPFPGRECVQGARHGERRPEPARFSGGELDVGPPERVEP
jgi:drug/metabolite transporter (DMT)-like permease